MVTFGPFFGSNFWPAIWEILVIGAYTTKTLFCFYPILCSLYFDGLCPVYNLNHQTAGFGLVAWTKHLEKYMPQDSFIWLLLAVF